MSRAPRADLFNPDPEILRRYTGATGPDRKGGRSDSSPFRFERLKAFEPPKSPGLWTGLRNSCVRYAA